MRRTISLFAAIAGLLTALPARSAERIQFFYGPFEPTIYIDDIEKFAQTGETIGQLEILTRRLSAEQESNLRYLLNAQYDIDEISIAQFAYSALGEDLLQSLGEIIQTENFLNGAKAIRAALIFAAANSEEGITIMDVLQQYPLETIQINITQLQSLLEESEQAFRYQTSTISRVIEQSRTQVVGGTVPYTGVDPQRAGPYNWRIQTIRFQNSGRLTEASADIYYPVDLSASQIKDIPVIVISHGVASDRKTLAYLAEHFVSHGYGVVVPEHIGTNANKFKRFLRGTENPPSPEEFVLRPQDITAVLDAVTIQQASDLNLARWDLSSVGVLGHSLGGYTALSVGGALITQTPSSESCTALSSWIPINPSMLIQCEISDLSNTAINVSDSRIKAVIALNPLASHVLGQSGLQQINIPVMIVAGDKDVFTPAVPEQIEPFSWLTTQHKNLVLIEQGTHFSLLNSSSSDSVFPITPTAIGPDPQQARPQTQALSVAFFNRHLRGQLEAEAFLNQLYLNEFPEEPFRFSIVDYLDEPSHN